jgi:hypothetical protein
MPKRSNVSAAGDKQEKFDWMMLIQSIFSFTTISNALPKRKAENINSVGGADIAQFKLLY